MCVVSMVMDHYYEKWQQPPTPWNPLVPIPDESPVPVGPLKPVPKMPTPEEIEEFRRLLERAREYDKRNQEPDCEMEEKKEKVRKLAEELGVKVDFI